MVFLYHFQGFIWDIAPFFNAMVIFAEHRYYGQSLPYGNKSLTPDPNFNGFLTSEQALADYAYLLHYIKVGESQNCVFNLVHPQNPEPKC